MKRSHLAVTLSALAVVIVLLAGATSGVAQDQPVPNARPTPTSEVPLPEPYHPPTIPESPEIPPLPDLVVVNISVFPSQLNVNEPVTIRVTIHNRSIHDVELGNNFWTDLYIDPAVVPIQLGQDGEAEWPSQSTWVPAGGYHTLETAWVFDDIKNYSLWAQVDTDGHVAESNENNNVLGPVVVEVRARDKLEVSTHEEFQLGLASGLDISHPDGVVRPGIFWQPANEPLPGQLSEPNVYRPDRQVDHPPDPPDGKTYVNQVKPALTGDGTGWLYAVWEDGRNGGVYNRDIYFTRFNPGTQEWEEPDVRVNGDPILNQDNQASPDIAQDPYYGPPGIGRLYVVWQDERDGDYDIYFAYSDDRGESWTETEISQEPGAATQRNPSILVETPEFGLTHNIYVVWEDERNGNSDIYITHSGDGGATWTPNYFVGDDPQMKPQNQVAPSVSVDGKGRVFVAWEDWRIPDHPEVYVTSSWDQGQTFGVDVPVTVPWGQSYRVEPTMLTSTTVEIELIPPNPPVQPYTQVVTSTITAIHVAWQENAGDDADIYWTYAIIDYDHATEQCPWPYDFCFDPPQKVNGEVYNSNYVLPPGDVPEQVVDNTWQGDVSMARASRYDVTQCLMTSPDWHYRGVYIAWSDGQSYDDWRYEINVRRVASPADSVKSYRLCEAEVDPATGVLNDNAKLIEYRDQGAYHDHDNYKVFQPAATGQQNPDLYAEEPSTYTFNPRLFLIWDDDRWDEPLEPNTVRNRDVFATGLEVPPSYEGIYISQVIDSGKTDPKWYVLSWWAATDHFSDVLFQTRFGRTPNPPLANVTANTWTEWTGNPSSEYLGCDVGTGCYYDAPGRHIVGPNGDDWFGPTHPGDYRYIQYKIIMRNRLQRTAVSEVTIHYEGAPKIYLPIVTRNY
ncbi:MAG: hypothetical protein JXA14_17100 [Anaerolineae bacterium]|nr:hypothetical protein [Anaerolineae bacterium]